MSSSFQRTLPSLPMASPAQTPLYQPPVSYYGMSERTFLRVNEQSDRPRSADFADSLRPQHDSVSRVMFESYHNSPVGSPTTYSDETSFDYNAIYPQEYFPRGEVSVSEYEQLSPLCISVSPPAFDYVAQQALANLGIFQYSVVPVLLNKEEILIREGCPICGRSTEDSSYVLVSCGIQGCSHVLHVTCLMENPRCFVNRSHFPFSFSSAPGAPIPAFLAQRGTTRSPAFAHHMKHALGGGNAGTGPIAEDADGQYVLELTVTHLLSNLCFLRYSGLMQSFRVGAIDFERIALPPEMLALLPRLPVRAFRLLLIMRSRINFDSVLFQGEWSLSLTDEETQYFQLADPAALCSLSVAFQCNASICTVASVCFDFIAISSKLLMINPFAASLTDSGRIDPNSPYLPTPSGLASSPSRDSTDSFTFAPGSRKRKDYTLHITSGPSSTPLVTPLPSSGVVSGPLCIAPSGMSLNAVSSANPMQTYLSGNPTIKSYSGRLVEMSSSQAGSKTLQELLRSMHPEDWACIEEEILAGSEQLITNQFGNYFIQRVLKDCPHSLADRILESLKPNLAQICCHKTGTYAIQNIIGNIIRDSQAHYIAEGIQNDLLMILLNQQSIHVVNKFLNRFEPPQFQFLIDFLQEHFDEITCNQFGITILRTCLQRCSPEQREVIVRLTLERASKLCWDEFGNYAVQYLLDFVEGVGVTVFDQLAGHVVELSQNKFGSNVIEKCLQSGDYARSHIIAELVACEDISRLMTDRYSNFVIQKAIQVAVGAEKKQLCARIKPNLGVFQREGKTVQSKWRKFVELLDRD